MTVAKLVAQLSEIITVIDGYVLKKDSDKKNNALCTSLCLLGCRKILRIYIQYMMRSKVTGRGGGWASSARGKLGDKSEREGRGKTDRCSSFSVRLSSYSTGGLTTES